MTVKRWCVRLLLGVTACVLLLSSCGGDDDKVPVRSPDIGTPGLSIISGNNQLVSPYDTLANRMVVELRDDDGMLLKGTYVAFNVASGPGIVLKPAAPNTVLIPTDYAGRAGAQMRAYAITGQTVPSLITVKAWMETDPSKFVIFSHTRQ